MNGAPQRPEAGESPKNKSKQQRRNHNTQDPRNRRRGNFTRNKGARYSGFKRRSEGQQEGGQQLGFFGSVPSLQDLQRENKKRTRRHYGPNQQHQYKFRGAYIRSHPAHPARHAWPAPSPPMHPSQTLPWQWNSHAGPSPGIYLGSTPLLPPKAPTPAALPGADANPLETPNIGAHLDDLNAADKLEAEGLPADLDFYGTNEGLAEGMFDDGLDGHSMSDGEGDSRSLSHSISHSQPDSEGGTFEEGGGEVEAGNGRGRGLVRGHTASAFSGGEPDLQATIIQRLRERVAEQEAYITQLEDDGLRVRRRMSRMASRTAQLEDENSVFREKIDQLQLELQQLTEGCVTELNATKVEVNTIAAAAAGAVDDDHTTKCHSGSPVAAAGEQGGTVEMQQLLPGTAA